MVISKVKILRANFSDATVLAEICKKAFDHISEKYQGKKEGPPGYDMPHWHTIAMKEGVYFQILLHDKIIGAIIIALRDKRKATKKEIYHWELVQMFIDPEYQGKGIGSFAVKEVERFFPEMYLLTLATPVKYISNNDFYKKLGFKKDVPMVGIKISFKSDFEKRLTPKIKKSSIKTSRDSPTISENMDNMHL